MSVVAAAPAARVDNRLARILALRFNSIWAYTASQGPTFWAILFYLFIEYVRPQSLFPAISFIPWGEVSIGLAAITFLGTGHWFRAKSAINWLLLLYLAVVLASSFQAYSFSDAREAWSLIFDWVIIYFLISNIVTTPERFAVFLLTYLLYNFYMSQGAARQWAGRGFSFANWGVLGAPGWFRNSGEFGVEMCVFLPISWHFYLVARQYLSKWKKLFVLAMPVTALMGCVASSSRGALVGAGGVLFWAVMRSKARFQALIGMPVLAAMLWLITPQAQKERFTTAGQDSTSERRLTYWKHGVEMLHDHPLLGVGYGNWSKYYFDHYVDQSVAIDYSFGEVQVSHNIFVECFAELGYSGLIVLVLLIVWTFIANFQTRKLARAGPDPPDLLIQMAYGFDGALIGWIGSGFFVTVLYYPFLWINLAFTVALNHIARTRAARLRAARAAPAAAAGRWNGAPAGGGRP